MGVSSVTWIVLESLIKACNPCAPISAAEVLTLRSPPLIALDVQAERLPDSNPSAKIKSELTGVCVAVAVGVEVGVEVAVCVGVEEGPGVAVFVGVGVAVDVCVCEGVAEAVGVGVVGDTVEPEAKMLIPSTSLAERPHALPSK